MMLFDRYLWILLHFLAGMLPFFWGGFVDFAEAFGFGWWGSNDDPGGTPHPTWEICLKFVQTSLEKSFF